MKNQLILSDIEVCLLLYILSEHIKRVEKNKNKDTEFFKTVEIIKNIEKKLLEI